MNNQLLKRIILFCKYLCILTFVFSAGSCLKQKYAHYKGKLVLSSSNRVPVSNASISFYQGGSGGIGIPGSSSPSSADGTSDANGFFDIKFPLGKAQFLGIPTTNGSPVDMIVRAGAVGGYYRSLATNDTLLNELFLYKKVDRFIIRMVSSGGAIPTDTFRIEGRTINGRYKKIITGLVIPAGTPTTIDTIANAIFTTLDVRQKTYFNDVSFYRYHTGHSYNQLPISMNDEPEITQVFYTH